MLLDHRKATLDRVELRVVRHVHDDSDTQEFELLGRVLGGVELCPVHKNRDGLLLSEVNELLDELYKQFAVDRTVIGLDQVKSTVA